MSGGLRTRKASSRRWRRLALIAVLTLISPAPWARSADDPSAASTSAAARQEAARAVPLAKVDAKFRRQVEDVLANPSLFRRLPTNVVDCRPEMFTFLAQNPEVLTEIWRELGLSKVELVRTGETTFDLRDHAGTTGKLWVVEQTCDANAQNRIVMYAEGTYDGTPFSKPVGARCVFLLRSGSVEETNGRTYVAARLDSFVKIDRATIEIMAQLAHPFVGHTADRNFEDTLSFISNLSYTAERRPESIAEMSRGLAQVAAPRRERLAALAQQCAQEHEAWEVSRGVAAADPDATKK
jgi:hypothetical protein